MPFGGSKAGKFDAPPQELRPQKIDPAVLPGTEDRDRFIERKRDDLVWRSLWRADAALKVEDYFRSAPRRPSLDDMMENIDLAPNAVDKDFFRAVAVVANKFREQKEAVVAVMEFLLEKITLAGIKNTQEALGKVLYEDMMNGKPILNPRTGIKLSPMNGFLLLTIENEAAYHALYDELTPENRSGGRFHRAQEITIAKRKVPVIVCKGERKGPIENDSLMIHEIQHWINEGLTGLQFMEARRKTLLTLPREERADAVGEMNAQRRIKDEVLAYLREGRGSDVEKTLLGPLYAHLFHGLIKDIEKRKKQLGHIQKALNRFAPLIIKYPRLRGILTYMLLPVPLGNIATRLDTIRTTFERTSGIGNIALPAVMQDFPEFLPRAFEDTQEQAASAIRDFQESYDRASRFMYPSKQANEKHVDYKHIRDEEQRARSRIENSQDRLRHGFHGGFVPYVESIHGHDGLDYDAYRAEQDSVQDVLDIVQEISKQEIEKLYGSFDDEQQRKDAAVAAREICSRITDTIKSRLEVKPYIEILVRSTGIEIVIMRVIRTDIDEHTIHYTVAIPREQSNAENKDSHASAVPNIATMEHPVTYYGRTFQDADMVAEISNIKMVPKAYAPIFRELFQNTKEIIRLRYDALRLQKNARYSTEDLKDFLWIERQYDAARKEKTKIYEAFFRNNAHIPTISEAYFPVMETGKIQQNEHSQELMEKFREDLFLVFNTLNQNIVDEWINPPEPFEEDWSRETAILDILQKKIGTQYGSGNIRDIGLEEVDFSEPGKCTVIVKFTLKDSAGKWQTGWMNMKLFARRKIRRQVAKTADSR